MKKVLSGFVFEKNYSSQEISLEEFFRLAKEHGFDGVDLRKTQVSPDSDKATIGKIALLSKKYDLDIGMITFRRHKFSDRDGESVFLKYMELMRQINCRLIKVSAESGELNRRMAEAAAGFGNWTATNNHSFCLTETVAGTLDFLRQVGHPRYGILYDPGHLCIMDTELGKDYRKQIDLLIPYMKAVICQNFCRVEASEANAIRGRNGFFRNDPETDRGVLDWRAIVAYLRHCHYTGPVIFFYPNIGLKGFLELVPVFQSWFE